MTAIVLLWLALSNAFTSGVDMRVGHSGLAFESPTEVIVTDGTRYSYAGYEDDHFVVETGEN